MVPDIKLSSAARARVWLTGVRVWLSGRVATQPRRITVALLAVVFFGLVVVTSWLAGIVSAPRPETPHVVVLPCAPSSERGLVGRLGP